MPQFHFITTISGPRTSPSGSHCWRLLPATGWGFLVAPPARDGPSHWCIQPQSHGSKASSALHGGVEAGALGPADGWDAHYLVAASLLVLMTGCHLLRPLHRMILQDFKAHFMLLVICKLSPGLLNQEVVQKWSYTMLEGRWEKGTTAGGPTKSPRGEPVHRRQGLLGLKGQLLQAKVGLQTEPLPRAPG